MCPSSAFYMYSKAVFNISSSKSDALSICFLVIFWLFLVKLWNSNLCVFNTFDSRYLSITAFAFICIDDRCVVVINRAKLAFKE